VIVGDYGRRRYLASAVRSLAAQTLPRDRFEVVVTKTYRDPELDRTLAAFGATVLFDEEPRIGRWLRRALNASKAPIVTFLDDDDEFEPDRLAHVLSVYRQYPDLAFYRNRVTVIDGDGRPIPPDRWRSLETDAAFDAVGPLHLASGTDPRLLEFATHRSSATFNSSTMAFRRELLEDEPGAAFERTQLPDQFFFLAALLSRRGVFLDDRRLTRYRYYPGNVTREVPWLGRAEESYRDMARLAARFDRADLAAWLSERATHYGRMFRGSSLVDRVAAGAGRREVAERTGEYLRYLGRHPEERRWTVDTWAAGVYGVGYLPFAPLVARLARARLAARAAG
jgi:glycosyltransferase involved in cell wall biosynthesis